MPFYEDGSYQCLLGAALIAKVLAGRCQMRYTRASVGQGTIPEGSSPKTLTEPPGYVMDAKIAAITNPIDGECQVVVQIYSADVETGFYATGIMLYAEDPDLGEVPYTYLKLEEGMEWIRPASSAIGKLATFDLIVAVGAVDAVSAGISLDAVATYEAVKNLMEEHDSSSEAHSGLLARMNAMEVSVNGSVTIIREGDPTAEMEGTKGQHYINIKTGTEWECTNIKEGKYVWELVDYNSENYKSMRDILAEASATAAQAKEVAEGAAKAIAAVQNTISVVPSQSGSPIYNKERQKPSWNNLALEMMDIAYGDHDDPEARIEAADFQGEIDAGTYKAYAKPKPDFTWGDKSRDEKEILWIIQRDTISTVPSVSGPLTYTGEAQAPVWRNFNPEQLTKAETPQTNAGTHSTSFTPTKNYQWSGGDTSTKVVKWAIEKAANTFSVAPSGAQSVGVGDTVVIQVTSNSDAQIAATSDNPASVEVTVDTANKRVTIRGASQGSSNITITSVGSTNCTDASTVIGVNVSRKNPVLSINPFGDQSLFIGGSKQIVVTTDSDGAVFASSNTPSVATASASEKNVFISGASVGSSVITVSVSETTKYNAASLTVNISVVKRTLANSTWDDIKAISDAGTAASYFSTGDTKSLTLNGTVGTLALSNLKVDAFILGINHNANNEGINRIHWAIGKINGVQISLCDSNYNSGHIDGIKSFNMNHWGNGNMGGWKGCDLRYDILGSTNKAPSGYGSAPQADRIGYDPVSYDIVNSPVANTLAAAFPKDVRKVLKTVTKYTDNVGNASGNTIGNITPSVDYFFLLAAREVYASTGTHCNGYESRYQSQYDYFKAANSRKMYKHDDHTSAAYCILRSPIPDGSKMFAGVSAYGDLATCNAHSSGGLFVGFAT